MVWMIIMTITMMDYDNHDDGAGDVGDDDAGV